MTKVYSHHVIEHQLIPLPDGTRLAARLWMPQGQNQERFASVLEYLPYRKRDGTAPRDESTYPVFAAAGIVGVRVDLCGHGESDGEFDDEYSARELAQGVDVVNWMAAQPWSNGKVGMMGISWGGFNSMQIAALHPEPLKATIAIGTTVDRYNDDIHYKNGCHLYSDFYWSNMMLLYASRPPDPALREDWLALWLHRLQQQPFPLATWLAHQTRDDYWQHGSICENYADYTVPTLVIGGFADHYHNAPPALLEHAAAPVKAVNGPWIHKYPHFAWPRPRMDFHTEAIAWWRHWLSDAPANSSDADSADVMQLPDYRAYMSTEVKPGGTRLDEPGRWVAWQQWPEQQADIEFYPQAGQQLATDSATTPAPDNAQLSICSPQDCGIACGEIFSLAPDSDLAGDQRIDAGGSLLFNTPPLDAAIETIGRPRLQCRVAIDQPLGNLIVRLIDEHPDGTCYRVSWGVLNLAHRNSQSSPEYMTPGEFVDVTIELNQCCYRFAPGHKLQLAISTSYWPAVQPPPAAATATLQLGRHTRLQLPDAAGIETITMPQPANEKPLPDYRLHSSPASQRSVEHDLQLGCTRYHVLSDTGEEEMPHHGLRVRHLRDETWTITPDNPLAATATGKHTWWTRRDDWQVRIICESSMQCTADHYHITATVTAWVSDEQVHSKSWDETIAREFT